MAFVSLTLDEQREDLLASFENKMLAQDEVLQCYFVSGDIDYLVVVSAHDINAYHEFARKHFTNEPNIKKYRTSFCLNRVKYNTQISIAE